MPRKPEPEWVEVNRQHIAGQVILERTNRGHQAYMCLMYRVYEIQTWPDGRKEYRQRDVPGDPLYSHDAPEVAALMDVAERAARAAAIAALRRDGYYWGGRAMAIPADAS